MKRLRIPAFILLLPIAVAGFAKTGDLAYTPGQSHTVIEILDELATKHYRKVTLDDDLSARLLDAYLAQVDPVKSYLLASDIQEFNQWRIRLDDSLKQGDLSASFTIFNRYRDRAIARLKQNVNLLKSDFQFNYSRDESLRIDPDTQTWQTDKEALDDFWRKRMKDSLLRLTLSGKDPKAARELLIKRYRTQIKQLEQRDEEDVFQVYMNALTGLYDPHTNYLSPRMLQNFNIGMSLSLEGIGAVLQGEDEYTKVVNVVPGGPADQEGTLAPGDKIIGIGQGNQGDIEDVIGWRLDDVVEKIRGPKGSTVRLQIIPANAQTPDITHTFAITRDKVKLEEQAAKSKVIDVESGGDSYRIGVIDVPAFYLDFDAYRSRDPDYKSTTRDVSRLLKKLETQNVDGVVLDLRSNGGGSLYEATTLTNLFIDPGPVVQIRHANHSISRSNRARNKAVYMGPLVVLIDRLSASASEIFAGAIQDYERGLIVGSQSYGKGTVQVLLPLEEGQLKLTESKFYRISGESTQHRGVVPDLEFPSLYNFEEIGESSEETALPWDHIHAVPYKPYGDLDTLIPRLQKKHQQRVGADPDFVYMQDELALLEQRRNEVEIPLNKQVRKALFDQREQDMLAIENKRRSAKGLPVYDNLEAMRAAQNSEQDQPDPLLRETAHILVDYINLSSQNPPHLVQRESR